MTGDAPCTATQDQTMARPWGRHTMTHSVSNHPSLIHQICSVWQYCCPATDVPRLTPRLRSLCAPGSRAMHNSLQASNGLSGIAVFPRTNPCPQGYACKRPNWPEGMQHASTGSDTSYAHDREAWACSATPRHGPLPRACAAHGHAASTGTPASAATL